MADNKQQDSKKGSQTGREGSQKGNQGGHQVDSRNR